MLTPLQLNLNLPDKNATAYLATKFFLMRNLTILFILLITASCTTTTGTKEKKSSGSGTIKQKIALVNDTTPKVTGIGGIFFRSKNPRAVREWYSKNLGLAVNDYGSSFEFRNANRPEEINYLEWSPFKEGTDYFNPSKKEFMINYRVNNMEGLIKKLRANGVTILDTIQTVEYGKFVHIMDTDGNKIELWEPIDSVLTKLSAATTK